MEESARTAVSRQARTDDEHNGGEVDRGRAVELRELRTEQPEELLPSLAVRRDELQGAAGASDRAHRAAGIAEAELPAKRLPPAELVLPLCHHAR